MSDETKEIPIRALDLTYALHCLQMMVNHSEGSEGFRYWDRPDGTRVLLTETDWFHRLKAAISQ